MTYGDKEGEMRSPVKYIKNAIWVVATKIRFGAKFSAGLLQTFDHVHPEIYKKGSIKLGELNQNRGNLYLVADGGHIKIGSHCFFNTGGCVSSTESIVIGDHCKFGNNLVIVDHDHNFKDPKGEEFISSPVIIGKNCWIGANVTILRGTTMGDGCVIGAGSVIKGNLEAGSKVIQKR